MFATIFKNKYGGHAFFSGRAVNFREEEWVKRLLHEARQELDEKLQLQDYSSQLVMLSPDGISPVVIDVLNNLDCRDFRQPCFREKDVNKRHRFFSSVSLHAQPELSDHEAKQLKKFIYTELQSYLNQAIQNQTQNQSQNRSLPLFHQKACADDDYEHMAGILGRFDDLELSCDKQGPAR